MFEVADINKDGVLDIVEFGRMVQDQNQDDLFWLTSNLPHQWVEYF